MMRIKKQLYEMKVHWASGTVQTIPNIKPSKLRELERQYSIMPTVKNIEVKATPIRD